MDVNYQLYRFRLENYQRKKHIEEKTTRSYLVFKGRNPLTGTVVYFQFGEWPLNVLHCNRLTGYYYYSRDAGISWERVCNNHNLIDLLDDGKVDVII